MDDKELRTLLQQLQDEISKTPAVDEKGRQMLQSLDEDIRALLQRSAGQPAQANPAINQRLSSALYHFEATHPILTRLLSELMETLSNAGI